MASVNDYGGAGSKLNAPSLPLWAAAVAAALDNSDVSVNARISAAAVPFGTTAGTAAQGNDARIVNAVPSTRSVAAGTGLTGGGALSVDRTLAVSYGTSAGTAAQGNDSRFADPQYDVNVIAATNSVEVVPANYAAHRMVMNMNCTFTFESPVKLGHTFLLHLSGAFTPTLPASVQWDSGTAPTYTSPSVYSFTTFDSGTTWIGSQVAKAIA